MDKIIDPHLIEVNTSHSENYIFRMAKPTHKRCLVMLFRTQGEILTEKGYELFEPGDFIIHSPEFSLYHGPRKNAKEGFRNDWFYIKPEIIYEILKKYPLKLNTLYRTGQADLLDMQISNLIHNLAYEDEFADSVISLILEQVFISVLRESRNFRLSRRNLSSREHSHLPMLLKYRETIRKNSSEEYDFQKIAENEGLSLGRFTALYRSFFGRTPFAELMEARNIRAKYFLTQTDYTVKEIADLCGWKDHRYFYRCFKLKNSISPTQYRRNH